MCALVCCVSVFFVIVNMNVNVNVNVNVNGFVIRVTDPPCNYTIPAAQLISS